MKRAGFATRSIVGLVSRWMWSPASLALFLVAPAGLCAGQDAASGKPLLANGGFEEVRAVSEQDWKPYLADGWILGGSAQLPVGWELGKANPGSYYFSGTVEVVETEGAAKEGQRCLRVSTPAGIEYSRAAIRSSFKAPASRTVAWSFWARGAGGALYLNNELEGRRFFVTLQYTAQDEQAASFDSDTQQTISGRNRLITLPAHELRGPVAGTWTRFSGVAYLDGCVVGKKVVVTLIAFAGGTTTPTDIYFDDIVFSEAPAPTTTGIVGEGKTPAVAESIVSRADYDVGKHWELPPIYGKPYWLLLRDGIKNERNPRFVSLMKQSAWMIAEKGTLTPPQLGDEPTPFMVFGLRFMDHRCDFFDDWTRLYGSERKPMTMEPRLAYDGVKGNYFTGWQSKPGLPQWLELNLEKAAAVESVRIYPAWQAGRRTECDVYLSGDGKQWKKAGATAPGVNSLQGYSVSCGSQEARWVKVEVTKDSLGYAFLAEVEAVAKDGAVIPVKEGRASSVADVVIPEGMKTLSQRVQEAAAKYGDRFMGMIIGEWDNDLFASKGWERWFKEQPEWLRAAGVDPTSRLNTREERMALIKALFKLVKETYGGGPFIAHNSLSIFDHYGLEFGSAADFPEITGQPGERVRLRMASARGAARQYGKPWISYLVNGRWEWPASMGMISDSLFFRELILSYMLGCSSYIQEQTGGFFQPLRPGSPYWGPSVYFEPLIRAHEFIGRHPDRGLPYTPIVLGLDWLHGHDRYGSVFYGLSRERPDWMIPVVTEMMLPSVPREPQRKGAEGSVIEGDNYNLCNSSYGDVFDIMVLNPPSGTATLEKLNAYKVMVLLAEIRWTKELEDKLRAYVEGGGTLFLAVDQLRKAQDMAWCGISPTGKTHESRSTLDAGGAKLEELPEQSAQIIHELAGSDGLTTLFRDETGAPLVVTRKVGKGAVIACAADAMMDKEAKRVVPAVQATLQRLHDESLPVQVEGDIQFAISRNETSWIVTLINNRGISKEMMGSTTSIDYKKYAPVYIRPRVPVSAAKEWMADEVISADVKNGLVKEVVISVPPGDVRVVELVSGPVESR